MKEKHTVLVGQARPLAGLYGKFNTQRELDEQYDVERAVPNFPQYINSFIKASEQTRNALKKRTVVSYGPTLMERLTIYPAPAPKAPVMVFIHGGYWKMGLGDDYDFVAHGPSAAGYTVVIVNYALAPHVSIPEIVRQARAAVSWTLKNILTFNGDPNKVYVAGHSAGGHLAAMVGLTSWEAYGLPQDCIKGILTISGLYDLEPVSQTFVQPSLRISAEHILYASPIRLIRPLSIPLIVAWGALETAAFQQQSSDYLSAWLAAGNTGSSLIIPGTNHFNILEGFQSPSGFLTQAVRSFANQPEKLAHY